MAKKKFVLRIEEDLYDAVEKWAADEFRSVNGQLEWLIFVMLKESNRLKKDLEERPPQTESS
ncbi:MAG: Arc family DNA binding domain-containing protein [Bacteroidetes bacterium]|nr:Arc family DNA binding domain-containing protein [Bacteroidota bacterium]